MAVFYVETFILQNTLVDAGLLWLAAAWHGGRVRPLRIALGAMVGGGWAAVAMTTGGLFLSLPMQGAVSMLMIWIGLGTLARMEWMKATGTLWVGSALLGGIAALGGSLALAGAATGVTGVAMLRRRSTLPPPRVTLFLQRGRVTQTVDAIVDTGNRALAPWTGLPVIFIPEGVFVADEGLVMCIRTAAGMRLLPYFVPDAVMVDGSPVRAAVALAPRGFLENALVPWALCVKKEAS